MSSYSSLRKTWSYEAVIVFSGEDLGSTVIVSVPMSFIQPMTYPLTGSGTQTFRPSSMSRSPVSQIIQDNMLITLYYNAILLYYYIRLITFFTTTWHQKGKPFWILLQQEMMGGIGINWTICKSFAPRKRQITMPLPQHYYTILKNIPPLACYSFDTREWILTFFGTNVTDKGSQKALSYATSSNSCFCTTWQKVKHENRMFTQMLY